MNNLRMKIAVKMGYLVENSAGSMKFVEETIRLSNKLLTCEGE